MTYSQRVLVIGASGTLGSAIVTALKERGHDVLQASRSQSTYTVDTLSCSSIEQLYKTLTQEQPLDAVAIAAGATAFFKLHTASSENFLTGLQGKALSQMNVVRLGANCVKDTGSFTLISGILTTVPLKNSSIAAAANGAVEGFARAAAANLSQRINVVSPTVLVESMEKYANAFPGFIPVPAAVAAQSFVRSIEGIETGQVFTVGH